MTNNPSAGRARSVPRTRIASLRCLANRQWGLEVRVGSAFQLRTPQRCLIIWRETGHLQAELQGSGLFPERLKLSTLFLGRSRRCWPSTRRTSRYRTAWPLAWTACSATSSQCARRGKGSGCQLSANALTLRLRVPMRFAWGRRQLVRFSL